MNHQSKVVLTEFLAPYKIVLMALIAAYCAGILPKDTHRPLLSIIINYIEGPSHDNNKPRPTTVPTLDSILISITKACTRADPINGERNARDIEKRVLHALWTLRSLDSLHSFITKARSLLVKNMSEGQALMAHVSSSAVPTYLLTTSSFLGKFILRCIEVFDSLEFDKADMLWKSFVNFRDNSKKEWVKRGNLSVTDFHDLFGSSKKDDDPSFLKSLLEKLPVTGSEVDQQINVVSQEDLTALVTYQVELLETYGTPTPLQLEHIFNNMAQSETGKIPQIHYISYLQCLRESDYEGAFKALHRYFDYKISNREGPLYHYALLSLASLHAGFNCDGEAIRAIEEAISVAREKKDMACLNYLLTWLFNFLRDRPNLKHDFYVSSNQLLQFLKFNAGECSKSLHSLAYQSEAAHMMMEGGSLCATLESFTKAQHISLSEGACSSSFIDYCSLVSSFWFRQGNSALSEVYCDIALKISTSISERVNILIRLAHQKFLKGDIDSAFEIFEEQEKIISGNHRLLRSVSSHRMILLLTQCLRLGHYSQAEDYVVKLEAQSNPEIDIAGHISLLKAELQIKMGNVGKAFRIVNEKLETLANADTNKFWFIRFSILKCHILAISSSPSRALGMSIQCFEVALSYGYLNPLLHSVLQMGFVLVRLEQYRDAKDLLWEALPKFESLADIQLKSGLYKVLAATMIELHPCEHDTTESVTRVIQSLELAIDGFKKISDLHQVKECLELQQKFGYEIQNQDILDHAAGALANVNSRIREEIKIN
jgi:anaphase-promoting complex subunit 5